MSFINKTCITPFLTPLEQNALLTQYIRQLHYYHSQFQQDNLSILMKEYFNMANYKNH